MKQYLLKLSVAGLAFYAMCWPIYVNAATVTWVGGSGDWDTATNWSTDSLPGTNDDVVIGAGVSITVTHSTGTDTVRSVQTQQAFVLSGGTLTVSNTFLAGNSFTLSGGALQSATVITTNSASLTVDGVGTLDGVTVNGVLDVGNTYNAAQLTVLDGLVLNGTAVVGNPTNGLWGEIGFAGSQVLSGSGTVIFGNSSSGCNMLRVQTDQATLTIGPDILVRGSTGRIGWDANQCVGGPSDVSVLNQGTISCDVSGGTITLLAQPFTNQGLAQGINGGTLSLGGTWNNSGTLVESGGTIYLGGNFSLADVGTLNQTNGVIYVSGTLTNTGATLTLETNNNWVLAGGTILGGSINPANGVSFIVQSGTLDGVTVNGVLDVGNTYNAAQLTVLDGLVLNGTAVVGNPTNGLWGEIGFAGSQVLGGSGTVVFGNSGVCNMLRVQTDQATLTIGLGIVVRGQGGGIGWNAGQCLGAGPQNVAIINEGIISCDVSGGTIVVNAQAFTNSATLGAQHGTLQLQCTDLVPATIRNPERWPEQRKRLRHYRHQRKRDVAQPVQRAGEQWVHSRCG